MNLLIDRSKTAYSATAAACQRNAIVMFAFGLLCVLLALLPLVTGKGYGLLLMAFPGALFLLWSFFCYRSGKQFLDRGRPQ